MGVTRLITAFVGEVVMKQEITRSCAGPGKGCPISTDMLFEQISLSRVLRLDHHA
jgi:hypothetical protein